MNEVTHHIDGWEVRVTVDREPRVRWVGEATKANRREQASAGEEYDMLGQLGARTGITHEKLLQSFGVES